MVTNGEDILASGQPREPEQEKRIRTMQEDLARASEHALPDLPIPTPSEGEFTPSVAEGPSFTPPPAPAPPLVPMPPAPSEVPAGLPVIGEEEIDLLGEVPGTPPPLASSIAEGTPPSSNGPPPIIPTPPPTTFEKPAPSFTQETPALTPEERLSYGEETPGIPVIESASPPLASEGGAAPVLRPEELLSFGEEALPEAKSSPFANITERIPIKFLALGGLGVVVIAAAGVAYLILFNKPTPPSTLHTPTPTISPTTIGPKCPEPQIPEPLIHVTDTKQYSTESLDKVGKTLERALTEPEVSNGRIVRAVVKIEAVAECRLLVLDEVLAGFGIILPKNVSDSLDASSFLLFLWRENGAMRVGFVIKTKNTASLKGDLAAWEPNMPQDLDAFLRKLGKSTGAATPTFQEITRQSLAVRYLNFPLPDVTIDYAIDPTRNLFLLTTSRASMFAAIDALP